MTIRWDNAKYDRDAVYTDIPQAGRYFIKREGKGARTFGVYLNGRPTAMKGLPSVRDAQDAVERAVAARQEMEPPDED